MFKKVLKFIKQFYYSFPVQLIILHFKRNHLLLILWFILFAFIEGWLAESFGVKALFLFPEYLNKSYWLSFMILGISFGGFTVAFHLYSYILHGARFRFIATVKKTFLVFSFNNMLIPFIFIAFYLFRSYQYQTEIELISIIEALANLFSFLIGFAIFTLSSFLYFIVTNKNFLSVKKRSKVGAYQTPLQRSESWSSKQRNVKSWKVGFYLLPFFRVRIAREAGHYRDEWIDDILDQNHVNASIFELIAILSFFLFGALSNQSYFLIPAAASVILFITIVLMIVSAFYSWIKGWTLTLIVFSLLFVNALSENTDWLSVKSKAYGLNYEIPNSEYSTKVINGLCDENKREEDLNQLFSMLDYRRSAVSKDSIMVIINVSGGGHRSSAWTFSSLFLADSLLNGALYDHSYLISGASGGMIGVSYWRDMTWRRNRNKDPYVFSKHFNFLTRDLLNPIIFTMVSNDFSFRFRKSSYKDQVYKHDRAFAFENQLNENTHHWFDVPISSYREREQNAEMPMLIFTPTILNDGRRLLISPLELSFLTEKGDVSESNRIVLIENVEFRSLFKSHDADSLRYLSALRMNATFPYILPAVTLPSVPEIEVMDAGIRDNYGKQTTFQFLSSIKEWTENNITKIVVIQLRYKERSFEPEGIDQSILSRISTPIGKIYENFENVQEYVLDDLLNELEENSSIDYEWINFEMNKSDDDPVSLNFHLSGLEKKLILNSLERPENIESIERLKDIFNIKE